MRNKSLNSTYYSWSLTNNGFSLKTLHKQIYILLRNSFQEMAWRKLLSNGEVQKSGDITVLPRSVIATYSFHFVRNFRLYYYTSCRGHRMVRLILRVQRGFSIKLQILPTTSTHGKRHALVVPNIFCMNSYIDETQTGRQYS